MSEEFWARLLDHLIQACMNIALAAIAAIPLILIQRNRALEHRNRAMELEAKLATTNKKLDANTKLTEAGAVAAVKANTAAVVAAKKAEETASKTDAVVTSTLQAVKEVTSIQAGIAKKVDVILKNGSGPTGSNEKERGK